MAATKYRVLNAVLNVWDPRQEKSKAQDKRIVRRFYKGDEVTTDDLKHADIDRLLELRAIVKADSDEAEGTEGALAGEFDPNEHNVQEVLDYLRDTDDAGERGRVLAAEQAGQGRKGVLDANV
jgi:hypothetical protein